ncbi:hypothetical protein L596_014311 [Steinernema carpocapsae]|uniref:Secreted protein n=1 Tax=Steinernema carpocapsae TaxID=34508 RepID=A0A4U5NBJ3_STECR|nr:hypothetical protein L596_014311 [Steinernema carpocapsae]
MLKVLNRLFVFFSTLFSSPFVHNFELQFPPPCSALCCSSHRPPPPLSQVSLFAFSRGNLARDKFLSCNI